MKESGFNLKLFKRLNIRFANLIASEGVSFIKSPIWFRYKNAITDPQRNDGSRFQYVLTLTQHHEKIKNHPEKDLNLKSLINNYTWDGIMILANLRKSIWTLH